MENRKRREGDWTARELIILQTEFPTKGAEYVAQKIGRSKGAVSTKASKEGIKDARPVGVVWSPEMLKNLKIYFPIMFNADCAQMIGVSPRSLIRKARELGLEKVPDFMERKGPEIKRRAGAAIRSSNNAHRFKPGEHVNPGGEFKPRHKLTPEQTAKKSESMKRYWARRKMLQKYGITQ